MNKTLAEKIRLFEEKAKELKALSELDEPTQENVDSAVKLQGDLATLKSDITSLRSMSDAAQDADSFLNSPEAKGNAPILGPGAGAVVSTKESGNTILNTDQKGAELLDQFGEGLLSHKQYIAIAQPAYKSAFHAYLRAKGVIGNMEKADFKVLQEGNDPDGGYLVPLDFMQRLIERKPTPTRVRNFVSAFNTGRDMLSIPKVDYSTDDLYTTGMRITWTGEIPASSTAHRATDPQFGRINIPINTAMISLPITMDMLEDSFFPVDQWVANKFGETMELLEDNEILNGPGVNGRPHGILKNPNGTGEPAQVVSGSASALTADGLIALAYAVPEQYDENCRFIFNKTATGKAIAQLQDASDRYLFATGQYGDTGIATARPSTLLGYPFSYSGFMPNPGSNAYPVIFGDPTGYFLVRRIGLSVRILSELYAETNQVLALGRVRFGGAIGEEWKLKIQKCST